MFVSALKRILALSCISTFCLGTASAGKLLALPLRAPSIPLDCRVETAGTDSQDPLVQVGWMAVTSLQAQLDQGDQRGWTVLMDRQGSVVRKGLQDLKEKRAKTEMQDLREHQVSTVQLDSKDQLAPLDHLAQCLIQWSRSWQELF